MTIFPNTAQHIFTTNKEVADKALELVLEASIQAIAKNGVFKIVLAGGTTPVMLYELLAKCKCDFTKWQFFIGDERCLPEDDQKRNSSVIFNALGSAILTKKNTFFISAHLEPEYAAQVYADTIANYRPFDMVLLGMGEDGHTASIFPGIEQKDKAVYVSYNSPKLPPTRITMSKETLRDTTELTIIITGSNKTPILKQVIAGDVLPVTQVADINTTILINEDALP